MKDIKIKPPTISDRVEGFAFSATKWIGSPMSLIVHTFLFIGAFGLVLFGVSLDQILLSVTTIVSFEAIYLSIFIQMTVNHQSHTLHAVQEDIEELQEDVEEIQEDFEESHTSASSIK